MKGGAKQLRAEPSFSPLRALGLAIGEMRAAQALKGRIGNCIPGPANQRVVPELAHQV